MEDYIASGRREGAVITVGGGRPAAPPKGWYVEPTVFADVESRMRTAPCGSPAGCAPEA